MRTFADLTDEFFPPGSEERRHLDTHLSLSRRTDAYIVAVLGWLLRIPLVGRLAFTFWSGLFSHDMEHYVAIRPMEVLHPYGAIGFCYLNDGMRPSLWHTWMELRGHPRYSGIYPGAAPRNRAEAEAVIAHEHAR